MVEVLIVQHGEKERAPGNPGLTLLGHRQAQVTADLIFATFEIGKVVSSPMRRARETAEHIASVTGLPIHIDVRLRERMNWDPERTGQTVDEFLIEWERCTIDRDFIPISGDSSRQASTRFREAIVAHSVDVVTGQVVVLVAHGGVTVDLLRDIRATTISAEPLRLAWKWYPGCSITHLKWSDGRIDLVGLPDNRHLESGLHTAHDAR